MSYGVALAVLPASAGSAPPTATSCGRRLLEQARHDTLVDDVVVDDKYLHRDHALRRHRLLGEAACASVTP